METIKQEVKLIAEKVEYNIDVTYNINGNIIGIQHPIREIYYLKNILRYKKAKKLYKIFLETIDELHKKGQINPTITQTKIEKPIYTKQTIKIKMGRLENDNTKNNKTIKKGNTNKINTK